MAIGPRTGPMVDDHRYRGNRAYVFEYADHPGHFFVEMLTDGWEPPEDLPSVDAAHGVVEARVRGER